MNIEFFYPSVSIRKTRGPIATEIHVAKADFLRARTNSREMESFRDGLEAYLGYNNYVFSGKDFEAATIKLMDSVCHRPFDTICFYIQENEDGSSILLTSMCKDKKEYTQVENEYPIVYHH